MSQKRRGPGVPRADEVPFGIRALERGVEVEGVWVSQSNTPEPSIRRESSASSIWDFMPKKSGERDLEKQEQEQDQRSRRSRAISDSAIKSAKAATISDNRAASAEDLTIDPSLSKGPARPPHKPAKSRHPPPSFAKYSGNPSLHRLSSSVRTVEGIEAVYRASTYLNPEARHGGSSSESYTQSSSGSSTSDSGPISSAAPKLLSQKSDARQRHRSADLEMLNTHRMSQAAETGQLTPRTRKITNSLDGQGYLSDGLMSSSSEGLGYFGAKSAVAGASTPPSPKDNPSPPKIAALPAAVRRSSLPDVTPFAQFVQTAPSLPRPVSLQACETATERASACNGTNGQALAPSAHPNRHVACEATPEQSAAGTVRPSFEKTRRSSQVIRGHGKGFEILKPGSLDAESPLAVPPSPERHHTGPPMSLKNYKSRSRSSSVGSTGKKLRKKRRPSTESESWS